MKISWNVKCIFFIMSVTSTYSAQLINKKEKTMAVKEIIQKIYNLTSQSLLNGTPDEKDEILKSIESKLLKSSKALGTKGSKYVKLIMKGLQIMAKNNTSSTRKDNTSEVVSNLRFNNKSDLIESTTNNELVKKVAFKIFKLAEKHFRRAKTEEDKHKIIENIKKRVLETAKHKHDLLHSKHNEIKSYTDLITRGMELMMDKITNKKRRMIMEFVDRKIATDRGVKDIIDQDYNQLNPRSNLIDYRGRENDDLELFNKETTKATTSNLLLTTAFSCDKVFTQTCNEIKSLNDFTCTDRAITLPINQLCDGVSNCPDGSDERNCVSEATKRLHQATEIMSRIEIYLLRNCFLTEDNDLLKKQHGVLYDVVKRQSSFIDKYKDLSDNRNEIKDVYTLKQSLNEVAIVVQTLAIAVESSLCNRYENKMKAEIMARKFNPNIEEDLEELPVPAQISLKSCKCFDSFCANLTCPEVCKRVCWHKYNLGKFSCQAVEESTAISLDLVCDGKLDCYDETDESGCNLGVGPGKFEANSIFQKLLNMINTKIMSKDYSFVKGKLQSLQNSIKQLQMEAMKSRIDIINLKNARNICFASLSSIYEDIVEKVSSIVDLENTHNFLLTVNELLMTALKHSHTGNDKILSPDGCYCRDGKCALVRCTKGCTRACSVEPKLTKYTCKGSIDNVTVTIDKICNGKQNCPFGDDEVECSEEVCRRHHLVLLRHNIRDVGANHQGTSLGESLRSWKTKVVSTLKIAENNYRPTPITLRDIISDVLHDLVMSYATLEDTRRNHGYAFNEFYNLSQLVIGAAKSCGK